MDVIWHEVAPVCPRAYHRITILSMVKPIGCVLISTSYVSPVWSVVANEKFPDTALPLLLSTLKASAPFSESAGRRIHLPQLHQENRQPRSRVVDAYFGRT